MKVLRKPVLVFLSFVRFFFLFFVFLASQEAHYRLDANK